MNNKEPMTMERAKAVLAGQKPVDAERWAHQVLSPGGEGDNDTEWGATVAAAASQMLEALAVADPVRMVHIEPYTNAEGSKFSTARVMTAGGRYVWYESSHCRGEIIPDEISTEAKRLIWAALEKCDKDRKHATKIL